MTDIPQYPDAGPPAPSGPGPAKRSQPRSSSGGSTGRGPEDKFEPEPIYDSDTGLPPGPVQDEFGGMEDALTYDERDLIAMGESAPPAGAPRDYSTETGTRGTTAGAAVAGVPIGRTEPASRNVDPRTQTEMGQLWGGVFFAVERPPPKQVAVTSAMRHEGVTQIATALAMAGASAQGDLRIALVDCNLRHPATAELLSLPAAPGLTDVLTGRASLESALHRLTLVEGQRTLHVLTAGSEDSQPLGLLRSRQFKGLLATLAERFHHVILDMPATNQYPDAQVIGALVDGTILVVKAGKTRRETIAEAKKRLDLAQIKLLGVVMNQRTYPIPGFIYRKL